MTDEEQKEVSFRVAEDGFDYAFRNYSDWEEIKDEKFHKLRKAYIKAAQALRSYVGEYHDEETSQEEEDDEA
jgi:hypothetical protein